MILAWPFKKAISQESPSRSLAQKVENTTNGGSGCVNSQLSKTPRTFLQMPHAAACGLLKSSLQKMR
jgi:hypothetical protein